ncbi:acetate--CoA ligase family protein [Chakrabartyella piscis]|uniref:acetate--CoA ligase family protein n=1 Tax=Chakrabartyella piscis TaxID=2918914 RepID=UPI002958759F|nr:acetate--CoA ligase family protein [Chakrabartyella piscis]
MKPIDNMQYLLNPKSIAILGCSEHNPGGLTLQNLIDFEFQGGLYPVHPKKTSILGLEAYPSLTAIPYDVECCVISLRSTLILPTIEEMKAKGVKAAVIFASGFSETGAEGIALEKEVARSLEENGIACCGANCLGLINMQTGIPLYSAPLDNVHTAGPIGMVAHSGSACIAMSSAGRGTGYSYLISCGNEAGLGVEDYFEYMLDDCGTQVLAGYLEAVRNPEAMAKVAAMSVEKKKPIVVFKTGRSEIGQKTAAAHSGALASSTAVIDAYFAKNGMLTVNSFDELAETCELLSKLREVELTTNKIACTAISGGQLGFTCDVAAEIGVSFGEINEGTKERIRAVLPDFATAANPLDVTTALFDTDAYKECIRALADDPEVGLILVCQDAEAAMAKAESALYCTVAKAIAEVQTEISKPVVVFSPISAGFDANFAQVLKDGNIPLLQGAHESLKAIKLLVDWSNIQKAAKADGEEIPTSGVSPVVFADGVTSMSEGESKAVFTKYGLSVAQDELVQTKEEAIQAAEKMGYPVVLKVDSPDILHKTEAGIVALDIANKEAVAEAYDLIMNRAKAYKADAKITGISVQEMVDKGVEMLVGAKNDPHYGATIMVGIGGIFVEIFKDFSLSLAPVSKTEALAMIDRLKGAKLLYGARGAKVADVDALADFLCKFSVMAAENADTIGEMDINPVIVLEQGKGVKAVDGLIVKK